jgi:hypothetical protein
VEEPHFQEVPHPHQHLGDLEGLRDEVLRACAERTELVIRLRGDDQHRKVVVGLDLRTDVEQLDDPLLVVAMLEKFALLKMAS